jgi:methionyl-tRNA formyltransferase
MGPYCHEDSAEGKIMTIQKNKKVGFFVGCDLIGLITLNKIIPLLDKMGILPVIYYTDTHLNRRFKVPPPKSVSFFNVGLLRDTILPTLEEYAPYEFHACSFRQLATRYGGTFVEIKDVNDPDFLESIRTDKELCGAISIRFLQVFEAPAIQTFEQKGFLWNLHGGILPQYKGLLLPFRAIANGEKESGLTLHKIREGIDTGDILEIGTKLLLHLNPYSKHILI